MATGKIHIFDTTLRDGEQVPGCKLNKTEKIEIAIRLEELGVDIIEAGFPISSPGDFESVQAITKVVKNTTVCGLSRAVEKDISIAAESLKYARYPRIHTGIGTSDIHIKHKFNSTQDEILERAIAAVKYAKSFVNDVEFYAEDAGRTSKEFLAVVTEAVIKAGATVINLPDTTGYCLPEQYAEKFKYVLENAKGAHKVRLSAHCHNDLGLATANAIAAVVSGARQIECTINGIGERAGNTSLEEVVMVLRQHKELKYDTSINSTKLYPMSRLVSEKMGMPVQPNKAVVGANAFAHSSGIHQDGVLKDRINYEIMSPEEVGVSKSSIILTARSGKAALKFHLKRLGFNLENLDLESIYDKFIAVADTKKEVLDSDLITLMRQSVSVVPQ